MLKKINRNKLKISVGCVIFLGYALYILNDIKYHWKKWIPSTMNFSNINILVHKKPTTWLDIPYLNESMIEIISGDRNIFFLETSHIRDKDEIILNSRQGCAVESAARMNPSMKIYFFIFHSDKLMKYSNSTKNIIEQLMNYENIAVRHISLVTYFENSPMYEWWNSTDGPRSSHWFTSHMSDVLRYLTLWKFGGIYLDLDVVIKSSLKNLYNFVCAEDSEYLGSSAIGFDVMSLGRRYANECLHEIMANFRGDDWAYNGPGVITRSLKKICNTDFIGEMTTYRCYGFKVLPPSAFYPIAWRQWKQYVTSANRLSTMKAINNSLAIHVWNKFSRSIAIKVGSDVPYALIASQYCPKVYNNCGDTF